MDEKIMNQVNNGLIANPFTAHCKESFPSRESPRVMQMLRYLRVGLAQPERPKESTEHLEEIKDTPITRQMRYFGAWSLDQWDYAAERLRQMNHDESEIATYKDDFISLLHKDFESGIAYKYADDWYQSFPNGRFFNPVRYNSLYKDEMPIAHAVEEHLQCRLFNPAVAGFMSYDEPDNFDHSFMKNAGGILVNYPSDKNVRDILVSQVDDMDEYVSELVGEDESAKHGQRIFVTDGRERKDGINQCVVYYAGFDTQEQNLLMNSVRNAIIESIPTDYFRDYRVSVDTSAIKMMKGQLDMCNAYLAKEPKSFNYKVPEPKHEVELSNTIPDDDYVYRMEEMGYGL